MPKVLWRVMCGGPPACLTTCPLGRVLVQQVLSCSSPLRYAGHPRKPYRVAVLSFAMCHCQLVALSFAVPTVSLVPMDNSDQFDGMLEWWSGLHAFVRLWLAANEGCAPSPRCRWLLEERGFLSFSPHFCGIVLTVLATDV